jgi:hypothetical protein
MGWAGNGIVCFSKRRPLRSPFSQGPVVSSRSLDAQPGGRATGNVRESVSAWLKQKTHLSGCVWTGLPNNWEKERQCIYSSADALKYLRGLRDPVQARQYVQNMPSQIQTEARALIRAELGWQDAELPDNLFETV